MSRAQEIAVRRMEVLNVVTQLVSGQTRDTDLVLSDSKLCASHHGYYPKQSKCHLRRDSEGRKRSKDALCQPPVVQKAQPCDQQIFSTVRLAYPF